MRVLILPSWYPTPARPILGSFVRRQAEALAARHAVRVLYLEVLPRGTRRPPRRHVTRERGYVEEVIEVPNRPGLWQFAYLWTLLRAVRRLRRDFAPDVIHAHVAVPAGWGAAVVRRFFGIPVVLTEHSSELNSWLHRPGLRRMAGAAFRGVDRIVAVGLGQRDRIATAFPGHAPLVVIPNLVDTARFTPTPLPPVESGYRLLFVGLMDTPQKGVPDLLAALARIRDDGNLPVHADLIGDGRLRPEYAAQAASLGLGETVTFWGIQPSEVVAGQLQRHHALVLPSLREAHPVVLIEALASGRPVVSTRCGGPEYVVDASNGLIVAPGDPAALAAAIRDLLTHLDRYDPAAIAAAAAARYSRPVVVAALTRLYAEVVAGRGSASSAA